MTRTILRLVVRNEWARKARPVRPAPRRSSPRPAAAARPRGRRRAPVFDIIGKRRWFFVFSALLTIPGLIFILLGPLTDGAVGLQFSIDYTGGTNWEIQFEDRDGHARRRSRRSSPAEGFADSTVQTTTDDFLLIRTKPIGFVDTPASSPAPIGSAGAVRLRRRRRRQRLAGPSASPARLGASAGPPSGVGRSRRRAAARPRPRRPDARPARAPRPASPAASLHGADPGAARPGRRAPASSATSPPRSRRSSGRSSRSAR